MSSFFTLISTRGFKGIIITLLLDQGEKYSIIAGAGVEGINPFTCDI